MFYRKSKLVLKKVRDGLPEELKFLLSNFFRSSLIKNSYYIEQRIELKHVTLMSDSEINNLQFQRLKEILIYAGRHVPYYREVFEKLNFKPENFKDFEELSILPFLTKEIIREHFDKLVSDLTDEGGYYEATTGGSSGEPLKVLLDYNSVFKENAFINHFRTKLNYSEDDKIATFRGIEFSNRLWKYNPMQNELIFSPFKLSRLTVERYLKRMNRFNPVFLNGYLSSLFHFVKLLEGADLTISFKLKGIFLISENIDEEQRTYIENFFDVKSLTFYGHSERCIIAEEINRGEFNFNPIYGYTELIGEGGNLFSIVGTGFLNRTMPLIRYRTDDLCSRVSGDNYKIEGRWKQNDYLVGFNDEKVFHSAFNFHSDVFQNVMGYQFIQRIKGKVSLNIIVNAQFNHSELAVMQREIKKKTRDVIDFEIIVVDDLILSPRGKFKRFISEL